MASGKFAPPNRFPPSLLTTCLPVTNRSLIALSLIMALLQFKPAPMYILDEIDAALDLSHTQHIGTRFRDGTSVIGRTALRSTSSLYNGERDWEEEGRANRR